MPAADTAARLGIAVTRLARVLRQQDVGELTPTMRSALVTVEREGPLTLGELAAREHIAPPTVTKVIGKLEDQGLVERVAAPGDRRVCRVSVSTAGRDRLEADRRRRRAWLTSRLSELDAEEHATLLRAVELLERLAEVPVVRQ